MPAQLTPKDQAQSTAAKKDHPVNPVPVLAPENPPPLSPRTQARLAIARELRDTQFRLYQRGEADLESYLLWVRRFTDVVASEGPHQTKDFDPIRLLEAELKGLKSLEKLVEARVEKDQAPKRDALTVKFFRLEAEEKLEKAKADRDRLLRKSQKDAPAPSPTTSPAPFRR